MTESVLIFLVVYGPAFALCALAFIWGRATRHTGIGFVLKTSAVAWAIYMFAMLAFVLVVADTCQGSAIYGYHDCTVIPTRWANYSLALLIFSIMGGLIYAAILFLTCGVLERIWRLRD